MAIGDKNSWSLVSLPTIPVHLRHRSLSPTYDLLSRNHIRYGFAMVLIYLVLANGINTLSVYFTLVLVRVFWPRDKYWSSTIGFAQRANLYSYRKTSFLDYAKSQTPNGLRSQFAWFDLFHREAIGYRCGLINQMVEFCNFTPSCFHFKLSLLARYTIFLYLL